ncbi:unnamed protein product, partial [Allacma fusca]
LRISQPRAQYYVNCTQDVCQLPSTWLLGDTMDQGVGLISSARINLVYRGDLIPTKGLAFINVEKVDTRKTHEMAAGAVTIVDSRRKLIVWSTIKLEREFVNIFRNSQAGILRQ